MKKAIALMMLIASPVLADESKPAGPPPAAVIEQSDLSEINRILDEQMPPRWGRPIIEFMNKIIARQQALKPVNQPIAPPHREDAPQ